MTFKIREGGHFYKDDKKMKRIMVREGDMRSLEQHEQRIKNKTDTSIMKYSGLSSLILPVSSPIK